MNKWMLIPALVGAVTIGGIALASDTGANIEKASETLLTLQEAKDIAVKKTGGIVTEIELDEEDNQMLYEVEVEDDAFEYDLKIAANTGEILKYKKETRYSQKSELPTKILTKEAAIAIAKEKTNAKAIVKDIEIDNDDGRPVIEIDLKDEQFEYELVLDAVTGEILQFEKESHKMVEKVKVNNEKNSTNTSKVVEPTKNNNENAVKQQLITKQQAIAIAKEKVNAIITDVEYDNDNGRKTYEVEMEDDAFEYEIIIDASTGKIISFEKDSND